VFKRDIFENITYNGIAVAIGGRNLMDINQPARAVPPILVLEMAYAASAAMKVEIKEVIVATAILFRRKGTIPDIDVVVVPKVVEPVPKKLEIVKLDGQKIGGMVNHSASGLNAVMKIQYIGKRKTDKTIIAAQNFIAIFIFLFIYLTP
jgi:hypothetical protein